MCISLLVCQTDQQQSCWLAPILEDAMRHFFERFLVEQEKELLRLLHEVQQENNALPSFLIS